MKVKRFGTCRQDTLSKINQTIKHIKSKGNNVLILTRLFLMFSGASFISCTYNEKKDMKREQHISGKDNN